MSTLTTHFNSKDNVFIWSKKSIKDNLWFSSGHLASKGFKMCMSFKLTY